MTFDNKVRTVALNIVLRTAQVSEVDRSKLVDSIETAIWKLIKEGSAMNVYYVSIADGGDFPRHFAYVVSETEERAKELAVEELRMHKLVDDEKVYVTDVEQVDTSREGVYDFSRG